MKVLKEWEVRVKEQRKNLWLVNTDAGLFLCKKFKGRFFVKDCADQLPVEGAIIYSVKL